MPRGNLPPEVHRVRGKLANGRVQYYFSLRGRKGSGFWKDARPFPSDPAFFAAYSAAIASARPKVDRTMTPAVVDAFIDSPEFQKLKPRTQRDYRKWLDRFSAEFSEDPIAMFQEDQSKVEVNRWRGQWSHSPKQYDYAGTVVTLFMNWAEEGRHVTRHHCRFKKLYSADRSDVVWTKADLAAVTAIAPEWVRRIIVTACETGLRPGA